jgi:hypothetical protein
MIKKITIITALLILSGCSTYYEMKNCEQDKNYIHSNPEAMENYKELVKKAEVRSYYSKRIPTEPCENNKCLSYDINKYDLKERYFNDKTRTGVYTIKVSNNVNDLNCIKIKYSSDKNCYTVTKNKNDVITSSYYLESIRNENISYMKFMNLKSNVILFEASFQAYHLPNFSGAPSGDICPIKSTPKHYNFNIFDYP